jgi:membrane protease subunit HflK
VARRDPKTFLFNVNEPEAFLRRVSESAMRELVGRSSAEQVRTERRAEVEEGVRALVQGTLDAYDAGISIVGVQLERADPPTESPTRSRRFSERNRTSIAFQLEADQYANRRSAMPEARPRRSVSRPSATGSRSSRKPKANRSAFVSVLGEYEQAEA